MRNCQLKNLFRKPVSYYRWNYDKNGWAFLEEEGSFIKTVIKENPFGKKPLDRPRLRWENRVKEGYVKVIELNIQWREIAEVRERWRQIYLHG